MRRLLIAGFLLFLGCKDKPYRFSGIRVVTESKFTKDTLNLTKISIDTAFIKDYILSLKVIDPSTAVLIDGKNNVHLIDSNFKSAQMFNTYNTKGLDMISPMCILSDSANFFNIYDLTTENISTFKRIEGGKWSFDKSITLPSDITGLISINYTGNSSITASSINNINGRLVKFSLSPKPHILQYLGERVEIKKNSPYVTGQAYISHAAYDPLSGRNFVAYKYTDIFESYDRSGKLAFRLQGPAKFDPSYFTFREKERQRLVFNKDTRDAYLAVECDEKRVYLLFSGKKTLATAGSDAKLYTYTTNGTPQKVFVLKGVSGEVSGMSLDKFNRRLYVISYSQTNGSSIYSVPIKDL